MRSAYDRKEKEERNERRSDRVEHGGSKEKRLTEREKRIKGCKEIGKYKKEEGSIDFILDLILMQFIFAGPPVAERTEMAVVSKVT